MSRFIALTALALAGCGSACDTSSPAPAPGAGNADCDAAAYVDLVGQAKEAAEGVPPPRRIFQIGAPVTMDFNPARVNVQFDENGVIQRVTCG